MLVLKFQKSNLQRNVILTKFYDNISIILRDIMQLSIYANTNIIPHVFFSPNLILPENSGYVIS